MLGKSSPVMAQQFRLVKYYNLPRNDGLIAAFDGLDGPSLMTTFQGCDITAMDGNWIRVGPKSGTTFQVGESL